MVSDKKVAILGLDNAGKSSIVLSMKQKFDVPKSAKGLKPTKKVARSSFQFMDHLIYVNDFGGQKHYIDEYLKHKIRYLSGIDLLFYVIDIQDAYRFEESISYLDKILNYFQEIKSDVPVVVLQHKTDPKISEDPTILKNIGIIKHRMRPWMEKFKIRFFQTSIFQTKTVIAAFSKGILLLYNQHEAIQKFLLDLVEKMENVMAMLLFEQNGIELGSYYLDNITISMQKKILTLYEISQRRIIDQNMNRYEFSDRLDAFTKISGVIQAFDIEGLQFFFVLILEEHDSAIVIDQFNFFEQSFVDMHEILRNLLLDDIEKINELDPSDDNN